MARRTSARSAPGTLGLIIKTNDNGLNLTWVDSKGVSIANSSIPIGQFFTWVSETAAGHVITTITIDLTNDILNDPIDVAIDQDGNP